MYTNDDIIKMRKNELFTEIQNIDAQLQEMAEATERLMQLKELRYAEHMMLSRIEDKGYIVDVKTSKEARVDIEEAVKRIFDDYGRPIALHELIKKLKEYGFIVKREHVVNLDIVQRASHGYYQLLPGRW